MSKLIKKAGRKIQKMLSPEEMTLISNIGSIIDELLQMSSGESSPMDEEIVMEQEEPKTEEVIVDEEMEGKEVKMIVKGLEETPSDSATASDDAEERIDEAIPEASEESLTEVEKAMKVILSAMADGKIKKAKQKEESPIVQVLNKIVDVQKSSQSQVNELSDAFGHILKAVGISEQLEVSKSKDLKPKKINKSQNDELLNAIKELSGAKKEESDSVYKSQSNTVRKNLQNPNILTALVGKK